MHLKRIHMLLALVACGAIAAPTMALASGGQAAATHTVTLKNFGFHAATLSIHRGDSVTWLWRDGGVEHNVTGAHFHSHTMGSGSYTVRFTHAGTFNYHCTIHVSLGMKGKIVVH
jgi:plastocyanin